MKKQNLFLQVSCLSIRIALVSAGLIMLSTPPPAQAMHVPHAPKKKGKASREPAQAAPTTPTHPLDPLTADEMTQAVQILQKAGKLNSNTLFPYIVLHEPPKNEVLAFHSGSAFRREAFVELYDRAAGKLFEAIVDLRGKKVADLKEIATQQPSVLLSEFDAVPPIVKRDPRFVQAMARRGIKNIDDVAIDIWAYGSPDKKSASQPGEPPKRLLRAIAYFKGKDKNFYAKPIEGFMAIVNMNTRTVEEVVDSGDIPVPPESADFDDASLARMNGGHLEPQRRPLVISQPQGVDFAIKGHEVRWHNWSFRYAMHPREGLVLYQIQYKDNGQWRPVIYRASLADMMVPYGHNDSQWTYRAAFDEGEYGIGRYSGSLDVGADVPDNARLFDATFADDFGKPYTTKNAVAIWERDGGLLWKHFDMYNGGNVSRRGRDLVIAFITTISNYDYGLNWIFKEDGSIELDVVLSGIMLTKGSRIASMSGEHDHSDPDLQFGHLVAPNVVAPHHQHFFNVRLDMDIDGVQNSVKELETASVGTDPTLNPAGNAFIMKETPLTSEANAARDLNFASQRKWKIYNPHSRTSSLGYPRGYVLIPGDNSSPYLQPSSPLLERGGFVKHHVWFTQERDNEMYAAGPYPTLRGTSEGLPEWIKQNRSLVDTDVVMWYTFALTHAPRPEEWPVMVVHRTGFKLLPAGFFDRNPALGVRR